MNKDDYNLSSKNHITIIDTLFTPFKQLIYANAQLKSIGSKNNTDYWYNGFKRRKVLNSEKMVVMRSGGAHSDESGVIRLLPAHIQVTFNDLEGKNTIRIFDNDMYRNMNNAGQKKKIEIVKEYFSSDH
ncbi:hypothetical protein BUZ57_06945 [Staphylococcus hyicus]|uniref:Uncharacterized protein n=2 Tax=Staphylococcus hyicus TaxID=1284 RepID=A0A418JIM0_STAHY|nr:hypothetical protein [Staphylococcus hyicus]RIO45607.1 hypothetical protein BUZ57_06945 [Staphylococcus hyicus]